jgi:ATP-dependent Clp protease ATP-binding subunit ClpA
MGETGDLPIRSDLQDKLTERLRKALLLALREAVRLRQAPVRVEHLVLGIASEGTGIGASALWNLGVDATRLREALLKRGPAPTIGEGSSAGGAIGRAIEAAADQALAMDEQRYIGQEHLLLAIVRAAEGWGGDAVRLLESLGAGPERVAHEVEWVLARPQTAARRDHVVTCRVDDRTLATLDALVEAGVYSTRSAAAARMMAAGIEANHELLEKVRAAVAEIRLVRERTREIAELFPPEEPGSG